MSQFACKILACLALTTLPLPTRQAQEQKTYDRLKGVLQLGDLPAAYRRKLVREFTAYSEARKQQDQERIMTFLPVLLPDEEKRRIASNLARKKVQGFDFYEAIGTTANLSAPISKRFWILMGTISFEENGETRTSDVLITVYYQRNHFRFASSESAQHSP